MNNESLELLGIYLQDHYAGATGGLSLAQRIAKSHSGPDGPELNQLASDVAQDRDLLRELMVNVGVEPSTVLDVSAAIGERLGRLKPDGHLVSRSPLSDVVEFELMRDGIIGKLACWRALRSIARDEARLSEAAIDGLIERADSQLALVERHWASAVSRAFQ